MNAPVIWTVYRTPDDRPGVNYFARLTEYRPEIARFVATRETRQASTLDGLRALLPAGLVRRPPDPKDDPNIIVELWISSRVYQ